MEEAKHWFASLAVLTFGLGLMPLASEAQITDDDVSVRATVYAWVPGVDGTTNFPTSSSSPSINVDSSKIIDNLKMTFMGTLDVRVGRWGGMTDVLYLDLGNTKNVGRDFSLGPNNGVPAGLDLSASFDLKGWIWTVAGTYALVSSPTYESQVVFGARMVDLEQTLDWAVGGNAGQVGLPGSNGRSVVDATNWDAVVGIKGNYAFGDNRAWSVPYYFDIGSGESKLTWQAMAGIGYSFSWGTVVAAYRFLDYEFKDSDKLDTIRFSGPVIGATFRF